MPSPIPLARLDGPHLYAGLFAGLVILGKVARVGLSYRVAGVARILEWQRWVSWTLLGLYATVFVTGILLLLPIPGRLYEQIVEVHLQVSVWALVPTLWHIWHYRRLAIPYLTRWASWRPRRYWSAVIVAVVPIVVLVTVPRGVSQLPRVEGGSAWVPAGLSGDYLTRIGLAPDGSIVAAGDAVYISQDGVIWQQVDLPSASVSSGSVPASGGAPAIGHHHGPPAPSQLVQAMAISPSGIYVGTAQGLYRTTTAADPLADLHLPGHHVGGIAIDPGDQRSMWVTSDQGPYVTADGGQTWRLGAEGLTQPGSSTAIAFAGSQLFVADGDGVFELDAGSGRWALSYPTSTVATLDAYGGALYAATSTGALAEFDGQHWRSLAPPGAGAHLHGGQLHVPLEGVTVFEGRLYAAGTAFGVPASPDGGRTWTQLGGGLTDLSEPGQLVGHDGRLWAATTDGLFTFRLTPSSPASPWWWVALLAMVPAFGTAALLVASRRPPRADS